MEVSLLDLLKLSLLQTLTNDIGLKGLDLPDNLSEKDVLKLNENR